ncbi:MAG: hypothetical protein ACK4VY_06155 [Brevundimonas sp.]
MKRGAVASLLVVTVAAGSPTAGPNVGFPDRATAMTASTESLAQHALRSIAHRLVEVQRPTHSGPAGPEAPLTGLRFATDAVSAGWPGSTLWIGPEGPDSPIQSQTVYKIVGDLAPLPDMWNDAYGAKLDRLCAASGRVIPTGSADFDQAVFFSLSDPTQIQLWPSARALQLAIADAAAGGVVRCQQEPAWASSEFEMLDPAEPEAIEARANREGCGRAGRTVAGLDLGRLQSIDVAPCQRATAGLYCLEAVFLRYAYFNHQVLWRVTLRYQEPADIHRDDVSAVSDVSLAATFSVYG